jgi:hypothetical protein
MNERSHHRARISLVIVILILTFFVLVYRILVHHRLEQTSLLFVGIPATLAILVSLTVKPKSATGVILAVITIALCMSGILLGEGFICILMASPLFYTVGVIIGLLIDYAKKRKQQTTMTCLLLLAFVPISFEGVSPRFSLAREEVVSAERIVNGNPQRVEANMAQSLNIGQPLPMFLRLRFPVPTEAHGSGLHRGDVRVVHFAGGEGNPGDLTVQVKETRTGYVRFETVSDKSKIAHWLTWRSAEFEWQALDSSHTLVRCTVKFRRDLDPAWYFRPWERYAVRLAADYLIRANATPAAESGRQ